MSEPLLPLRVALDLDTVEYLTIGKPWYRWVFLMSVCSITALIFFIVDKVAVDFEFERAATAALSFALSVLVFLRFVITQRVPPIAFQYCARGATLAVIVAVALEIWSQTSIQTTSGPYATAAIMFFVGFSEEGGKLLSLLVATSYETSRLQPSRWCATLVRDPQLFAYLGVCVGFGFMLTENIEYFLLVDLQDPPEVSNGELRMARIVTALLRSFLNLHPVLSGLVAARLASRLVKRANDLHSHVGDWLHALWLPALIHGGFDFAAVSLQDSEEWIALVLVLGTWVLTLFLFLRQKAALPRSFQGEVFLVDALRTEAP